MLAKTSSISMQKGTLINKELISYGIFDCVENNFCPFACPSKIPLAGHIKLGQQRLLDVGFKIPPAVEQEEEVGDDYYVRQEG